MSAIESDVVESHEVTVAVDEPPLVSARAPQPHLITGVLTGTLIGFTTDSQVPLVLYAGQQGSAAIAAASIIDLHGAHIGRRVALMFEGGDPQLPMIMGLLRGNVGWPLAPQPGQVEVHCDGERLIVSAKDQLVLRCGKASITLTRAGKILINGAYVSSRSTGTNRVTGGSVQLN